MNENEIKKPKKGLLRRLVGGLTLTKINFLLWAIIIIIAIVAVCLFVRSAGETELKVEVSDKIDQTPTIVTAMKEIGEWQFLSIDDEELVDTSRSGFLRDDKLVRIYYGKLSLGIDMHNVEPHWVEQHGDTIIMKLPKIGLLDKDFIDEAQTKAFIETGNWTNADREALYHKAYARMTARCLTKENLTTARKNATEQIGKLLRAMGIEKYSISFAGE